MNLSVVADGRRLTVEVRRSLAELADLRERWSHVYSAEDSGFLSWEWISTWAERFVRRDRQLLVLAVYDRTALVGIAPWYVGRVSYGPVRVREIGFLGSPDAGSDYLDVLAGPGKERVIAAALLETLFGPLAGSWDTLALNDIPADSPFLARFLARLRRSGKHYITDEGTFCPAVRLPEIFETYLERLSPHARAAYRRKMRGLNAYADLAHIVCRQTPEVLRGLCELRRLYEKRWGKTPVSDDLFDLVHAYVERPSDSWTPEVSLLQVGGRTIAALLHFVRGRVMYQYLMAVDRDFNRRLSVGSLACALSIQSAIERGFEEYDFLKREEEYKLQFTPNGRRSMNVRVHNRTVRSLCAWSVVTASGLGKVLLR